LDTMEYLGRQIREEDALFGGIQVVLCGDFLQLPPVERNKRMQRTFCFEADCWKDIAALNIELKEVYRQRDPAFVNILNEIRRGRMTLKSYKRLQQCESNDLSELEAKDGIVATKLHSLKQEVAAENQRRLDELPGQEVIHKAKDFNPRLLFGCPAPAELKLKKGAQVILLRNLRFERGLVNGARGVVEGFSESASTYGFPTVRFTSGYTEVIRPQEFSMEIGNKTVATRKQFPLDLAWALSIHKSQGMTIDRVVLNLGSIFECGMAYVALSRVTTLAGLRLIGLNPHLIKAHPKVLHFYRSRLVGVPEVEGKSDELIIEEGEPSTAEEAAPVEEQVENTESEVAVEEAASEEQVADAEEQAENTDEQESFPSEDVSVEEQVAVVEEQVEASEEQAEQEELFADDAVTV